MSIPRTAIFTLVALFATAALAPSAGAVPAAVDQYTEQLPTPGGDTPVPPKRKPSPPAKQGGETPTEAQISESPSVGSPAQPAPEAAPEGGDGDKGKNGKKAKPGKGHPKKQDRKPAKAPTVDVDEADEDLLASTEVVIDGSSAGEGEGSGWLFPAMLIAVTVAILVLALGRRNSGKVRGS